MKTYTENAIRIIGCLIEKSLTTPDQYPLSLNALTNACNQKSNREPVLNLSENTVLDEVNRLVEEGVVREVTGFGSRVAKYQHRFCNTEFSELKLSAQELGILCVMFVRGPQTAGELRTRTNRLCTFAQLSEVEQALEDLVQRELVVRLERVPGKREVRFAHLFCDLPPQNQAHTPLGTEALVEQSSASVGTQDLALSARVAELESQVVQLIERVETLEALLEE